MATRTVLVDDMDGGDADVTIGFVINGDSYSIDLSNKNAEKFYAAIEPFVKAAKPHNRISVVQGEIIAVQQRQAIRDWARKSGYDVAERGRIPQDIVDAYNKKKHK